MSSQLDNHEVSQGFQIKLTLNHQASSTAKYFLSHQMLYTLHLLNFLRQKVSLLNLWFRELKRDQTCSVEILISVEMGWLINELGGWVTNIYSIYTMSATESDCTFPQ